MGTLRWRAMLVLSTTMSAGISCDVEDPRDAEPRNALNDDEEEEGPELQARADDVLDSDGEDQAPDVPASDSPPSEPSSEPGLVADRDPIAAPTCGPFPVFAWSGSCEWVKTIENSGTDARADCSSGVGANYVALSGGCWTGTAHNLVHNMPDSGSQSNLPTDGTSTGADGWSCRFSGNADATHSHRAVAYCCTGVEVATCP